MAAPGFVMGLADMQQDLGISHFLASLALSIFALGFALGPLVLAPISEVYGRNPMYLSSTVLFTRETIVLSHHFRYANDAVPSLLSSYRIGP